MGFFLLPAADALLTLRLRLGRSTLPVNRAHLHAVSVRTASRLQRRYAYDLATEFREWALSASAAHGLRLGCGSGLWPVRLQKLGWRGRGRHRPDRQAGRLRH